MDDFFCYCGGCGEITLHCIITFNPVDIRCAVCRGQYSGESPPAGVIQNLLQKLQEKLTSAQFPSLLLRSG